MAWLLGGAWGGCCCESSSLCCCGNKLLLKWLHLEWLTHQKMVTLGTRYVILSTLCMYPIYPVDPGMEGHGTGCQSRAKSRPVPCRKIPRDTPLLYMVSYHIKQRAGTRTTAQFAKSHAKVAKAKAIYDLCIVELNE